jgi:hypothetical protein
MASKEVMKTRYQRRVGHARILPGSGEQRVNRGARTYFFYGLCGPGNKAELRPVSQ